MATNGKGRTVFISYGQLDAIHSEAGRLEISARRAGHRLPGGLFVGSVRSIDVQPSPDYPDDVRVTFRRYGDPLRPDPRGEYITRDYSYFGTTRRAATA